MTDPHATAPVPLAPAPSGTGTAQSRMEQELARRVLQLTLPIDVVAVLGYALLFALRGHAWHALLVALQAPAIGWAWHLARRNRPGPALQWILWPSWIVNAAQVVTEGVLASGAAWWVIVPPVVLLQAGALRSGVAMGALTLAGMGACFALKSAGWLPVLVTAPPLGPFQGLMAALGAMTLVGATVWLGVLWRRALLHEVDTLRADAEEVTRVKSRFIANISHEIRTPLNGIVGAAELLRLSTLDAAQQRAAQIVDHSAQSLLAVVNDVLDFSKLEAGRVELERIALDQAALVYDTAEAFSGQAHARGVELWAHVAATVPAQIESDPVRLRQVLHNLVSNALKFTERGEIRVGLDTCEDPGTGAMLLRFAVRDTGIGLDDIQKTRLFRAFTQADVSTTRRFGGTGLGLVICRELAELLGGRLELDSKPGVGSTFALLLPMALPSELAQTAAPPPRSRGRAGLLICAARAALREDLRDWAARDGTPVEARLNGMPDQWLQAARAVRANVVVMDDDTLRACGLSRGTWASWLNGHGLGGVLLLGVSVPVAAVPPGLIPLYKPTRPSRLDAAVRDARRLRARANDTGAAVESPPEAPAAPDPMVATARTRVLLVEDNSVNQAIASALLDRLEVDCDVAPDGNAALELLESGAGRFSAVLMDCQMPVLDGYAATRVWRERERVIGRRRLPVIAMTANSEAEAGAQCEEAGMDDFVAKPFTLRELKDVLSRWVAGVAP